MTKKFEDILVELCEKFSLFLIRSVGIISSFACLNFIPLLVVVALRTIQKFKWFVWEGAKYWECDTIKGTVLSVFKSFEIESISVFVAMRQFIFFWCTFCCVFSLLFQKPILIYQSAPIICIVSFCAWILCFRSVMNRFLSFYYLCSHFWNDV